MGDVSAAFGYTFREYESDGVPGSGPHQVSKAEAKALGSTIEAFVSQVGDSAVAAAEAAAAEAEAYAAVAEALINGKVFSTTAEGVAGTADGGFFFVVTGNELLLYKDVGGVATSQGYRPISRSALNDILKNGNLTATLTVGRQPGTLSTGTGVGAPFTGVMMRPAIAAGRIKKVRFYAGSSPGNVYVAPYSRNGSSWSKIGEYTVLAGTAGLNEFDVDIPINALEYIGYRLTAANRIVGVSVASNGMDAFYVGSTENFTATTPNTTVLHMIGFDIEYSRGYDGALERTIARVGLAEGELGGLVANASPIPYSVHSGAAPGDQQAPLLTRLGEANYKWTSWLDVSDADALVVTGSNEAINWYGNFRDKNWNRVGSCHGANGIFRVPIGAKYFGRTLGGVVSGSPVTENVGMQLFKARYGPASRTIGEDIRSVGQWARGVDTFLNEYTPNDFPGATQNARIKAAVNFINLSGGGKLVLGLDTVTVPNTNVWVITEPLLLGDNFHLHIDHATLKQADGIFDNMIRNKGIVPNPDDPNGSALALEPNYNIKITGSDRNVDGTYTAFIEGPDVPYTAPHPVNGGDPVPWTGDWYGWRNIILTFVNLQNYEISNIHFSKTTSITITNQRGCRDGHFHDLRLVTNVKNGCLLDFRPGTSHMRIEDCTGISSDDLVAIVVLPATPVGMTAPYIWPLQLDLYARGSVYSDDAHHFSMRNITGVTAANTHIIRILAANGGKIHHVNIDHVTDEEATSNHTKLVAVQTGLYGGPGVLGDLTNITINDIESFFSASALAIEGPLKDCWFNNIVQHRPGAVAHTVAPEWSDPQYQVNVTYSNETP